MTEQRLLDSINTPDDLKKIDKADLEQVAQDVRTSMIDTVSLTGGHLGAGLGVVELTTALHYVFNTPEDRLIWDVGHQCYPHKILTARKDRMRTIRQGNGLSGFTKRKESVYDPFGAGHSSTSLSAGYGMAVGKRLKGQSNTIISVIGDGSMSAGMAYEAMNNIGAKALREFDIEIEAAKQADTTPPKMIVILNDNEMSIAPPVGAMSAYLSKLISSKQFRHLRELAKKAISPLPKNMRDFVGRAENYARNIVAGSGTLFEELGFYYIGPVDGHNMEHLVTILENVRDCDIDKPVLIHAVTQKGKGYAPAEGSADKMHGVSKFCVATGVQDKKTSATPSYTNVFADSLIDLARDDKEIVAVTAAMPSGTGVAKFAKEFPNRTFDVGIAEQHAVTFAAGLACEGLKPFAAIYSTFLQRAYDQVVHDVAIQNLPVKFAIDRAGLVGADGQTHAGSFDIAYLGCIPNMVLMASGDEAELVHMVKTATDYNEGPIAFRYPRGNGVGVDLPEIPTPLEIGKGRVLKEGSHVALLSYGGRLKEALLASEMLEKQGISTTVADARFAKPLDVDLIEQLAKHHEAVITLEEGSIGGFGALVLHKCAELGLLDKGLKIRTLTLPDMFQDQDNPEIMYQQAGLDAASIVEKVFHVLGRDNIVPLSKVS